MEFFEALRARRSVRKYTAKPVPAEVIEKAIDAALIAPNSSNMQTWEFYWVKSPQKREALNVACLGQSAARTAPEIMVACVNRKNWKRSQQAILASMPNPPAQVLSYYGKLIPFLYGMTWLAPVKWLLFNAVGLFKPMTRKPYDVQGINETCVKSCALACENFMLAIAAQGFDTCPMEGFDEVRVKRLLGLPCSARVVMVMSIGERDPAGIWGPQLRLPRELVFKTV